MRSLRLLLVFLVVATCADAGPVPPGTEVVQIVSLQDAARAGLVQLSAKGTGIMGDQVAVELTGARIQGAPIQITFHVEFFGRDAGGAPWPPAKAAAIAAAVQARLAGLTAPDGGSIDFVFDFRVRNGTSKEGGTAGYHQIELLDRPPGFLNFTGRNPGLPDDGTWGANETATVLAHEVLHLTGLRDQYSSLSPVYVVAGVEYPLPAYTGDRSDSAAKDAYVRDVLFPAVESLEAQYGRGEIRPGVPAGYENDIMANYKNPNATVSSADLQSLVDQAGVRMHAEPADAIVNKKGNYQNYGVGLPLDLFAPRGKTVRIEGMWVFCIDHFANPPNEGQRFDVLGPLTALPYPQLPALAQLLHYLALQDPNDPDVLLYGQHAVWSLTDGDPPEPEAQAILTAAGVEFDAAFFAYTPHFETPNAAAATTAAVSENELLPPIPTTTGPPPIDEGDPEPTPRLGAAVVTPAIVRARGPAKLAVLVEDASDRLTITLERRKGKRWLPVGDVLQQGAPVGLTVIALPTLAKKGAYRVRVGGLADMLETRFKVKKGGRRSAARRSYSGAVSAKA
jgi:hypothetical protein